MTSSIKPVILYLSIETHNPIGEHSMSKTLENTSNALNVARDAYKAAAATYTNAIVAANRAARRSKTRRRGPLAERDNYMTALAAYDAAVDRAVTRNAYDADL